MQPPASRQADPEPHIVDHVPDEVCVLVRADDRVDPAQVYDDVRTALNGALAGARQRPYAGLRGDLVAEDLEPNALLQSFRASPEVLQRLGASQPWLLVPSGPDEPNWHFYYVVGPDRVDLARDDERRLRMRGVRELVNLLNRPVAGLAEPLVSGPGWSVLGGAANWLTVAAQIACGCPASLPIPEPRRGRWRFRFGGELEGALSRTRTRTAEQQADVVVAILDTWPDRPPTDKNAYLAEVLSSVEVHPPSVFERYAQSAVRPWWNDRHALDPEHTPQLPIPDHGLFVAGIIHDIAPQAEIHVFPVLNEFGIGDAFGLVRTLSGLPEQLLRGNPNRRLIVNLSFGATVPIPPRRHWERWLPASREARRSERYPRPDPEAASLLGAAHSSLARTISWLRQQNVLVVAAAGNDALRPQTHDDAPPPPRYPACYEDVFAVAATAAGGTPASYSNRADIQPFGNGITTFGGDVADRSDTDVPRPPAAASGGREDAVVGVYASEALPDGVPNTTGWVRWAGTSFAAPTITGVAARLWSGSGGLAPDALMHKVLEFTTPVPGGTRTNPDPDGALDAPLMDAWQEFAAD
jgi:Subtilase family